MPRWFYKACRDCGAKASDDVTISRQGYCSTCGLQRATDAIREMADRRGERYEKHIAQRPAMSIGGSARGVGGTPRDVDDDGTVALDP